MKTYEEILEDLERIQNDLQLTGEAVELNKRLAAYVYHNSQIDVLNAIKESSLNTAALMNSKIANCIDNMYSVFRGVNPILKVNLVPTSTISFKKFDLVYTSNQFKLYAAKDYSFQPSLPDNQGNYKPVQLDLIVSKRDKVSVRLNKTKLSYLNSPYPYYIDLKVEGKEILAQDLSEHVLLTKEVNGQRVEVPWTRIFAEHSRGDKLFLLTLPDFGLRLYKKGYFREEDDLTLEYLTYTTLNELNLYDFTKIKFTQGYFQSISQSRGEDTVKLINIDDSGTRVPLSNINLDKGSQSYYQMILSQEIERDSVDSLHYQANFAKRTSADIVSNNDIIFLFSEEFRNKVLSCNFSYDEASNSFVIYYVQNPESEYLTEQDKREFLQKYDTFGVANSSNNIVIGNPIQRIVSIEYSSDNLNDISSEITNLLNRYNYILGQSLNINKLTAEVNRIQGVDYVSSLRVEGIDTEETLNNSQYYVLRASLSNIAR